MTACKQAVLTLVAGMVLMTANLTPLRADTAKAQCGFAAIDNAVPKALVSCSFSQRQGFIHIMIDDGAEFNFSPTGDTPGNYTDQAGQVVYRRSDLGEQGLLFQLVDRFLYVYWARDRYSCEALDIADPGACQLTYGGLSFRISATADGSLNQLSVQSVGLAIDGPLERIEIDGTVYRAEIADLDSDGWPEVYIYVSSAGSGSYGSLVAYAVNNGKSMTPVYLPPLIDHATASAGYLGHDEFAVVENRLVQRFPVYLPGDTNSAPSGGMRQVQYRLTRGEAGWVLVADKVVEY